MFIPTNEPARPPGVVREARPQGLIPDLPKVALALTLACVLSACASGPRPYQAADRPGSENSLVINSQTGRFVLRVEDPNGSIRGAQGGFELLQIRNPSNNSLGIELHLYGPMNQSVGSLEQVGDQLVAKDGRGRGLSPTELTQQLNALLGQADWLDPLMAMDFAARLIRHIEANDVNGRDSANKVSETEFTLGELRLSLRTIYD